MSSSPPFSHKTKNERSSPPDSRPKPHTAATVIPALHPPSASSQSQRYPARSSAAPPSASPDIRRRSGTTGQSRPPPLDLNRASVSFNSRSPRRLASLPEVPRSRPSSPIPIPPRPKEKSPPTTPLTARARSPINFFGFGHAETPRPHISASLTPYYTTGTRRMSNSQPDSVVQRGFPTMGPTPGSPLHKYTPTSPLSPKMTARPYSNVDRPRDPHPAKSLNIANLPKFHPANFPSRDAGPAGSAPRNSRPLTSQPRAARGSDAQQKLHQYQREVIASATQSSRSILSDGLGSKPNPPRLTPLRSPVDPMTPLTLEAGDDYLQAKSSSMLNGANNGDGREMVERLVRRENERRKHHEARSRSVSPALSPVLSPALSPA